MLLSVVGLLDNASSQKPGYGVAGEIIKTISLALDMGPEHVVTIDNTPSPERFKAISNGRSRSKGLFVRYTSREILSLQT